MTKTPHIHLQHNTRKLFPRVSPYGEHNRTQETNIMSKVIDGYKYMAYKATSDKATAMQIKKSLEQEGYIVKVRKGGVPLSMQGYGGKKYMVWMRRT